MFAKIDHIAVWADDLELLREFYMKYFGFVSSEKYVNPKKRFTSYFLSSGPGTARIELMNVPDMDEPPVRGRLKGLAHLAISAGSRDMVDVLTDRLRQDGYSVSGEPRVTGDGCYESVILDPEGNIVEIVAE